MSMRSFSSSWLVLRVLLFMSTLLILSATSLVYHTTIVFPLIYGGILLSLLLGGTTLVLVRRRTVQRRLKNTLYAMTRQRLIVLSLDRDQIVQKLYSPSELGQIDLIARSDGWGDIVLGGQQLIQTRGFSLVAVSPLLSGVENVREVALLLTRLKSQQSVRPL